MGNAGCVEELRSITLIAAQLLVEYCHISVFLYGGSQISGWSAPPTYGNDFTHDNSILSSTRRPKRDLSFLGESARTDWVI